MQHRSPKPRRETMAPMGAAASLIPATLLVACGGAIPADGAIDRNAAHYLPLRALDGTADEARRIIHSHAGERAAL